MMNDGPRVAIVDYGLGNLFGLGRACDVSGLVSFITSDAESLRTADAVILPGVGAFKTAMSRLQRGRWVDAIQRTVDDRRLLVGICLGMQLLFESSSEFGRTDGLGILPGEVVRFPPSTGYADKVPHIGWNHINPTAPWCDTLLDGIGPGSEMYFVHSYYVRPTHSQNVLSTTRYGALEYCSSVSSGNIYGFQFHPERSGRIGLRVFDNIRDRLLAIE